MDTIKPISNVDEIAKRVFYKSIDILGGIKNLMEYGKLTWLPSLAEASYVVTLKNEGSMTNKEIAQKLGISEQTVESILRAKEASPDELTNIDTHKAGSLAKAAYRSVRTEKSVELDEETADVLNVLWAFNVLRSLKGASFPLNRDKANEILRGLMVKGRPIEEVIDAVEFPVRTPAELIKRIKNALQTSTM